MTRSQQNTPSTITVRFGEEILEAGFTVVPNLILRSYTTVGMTPIEMMFVIHIWEYWWTERDPYPALGTIAERMGMTRRNARRHVQSLRDKGLLIVNERNGSEGQTTSEYDFEPLIRAVLKLSTPLGQKRPTGSGSSVREPRTDTSHEEDVLEIDEDEEVRVRIERFISDFAREFRDRAPLQSSVSRAFNIYTQSGLELEDFTALMYEARAKTKATANVKNRFAYFMTVLEDLSSNSS